jgi:hypothetical protein
MLQRLKLSIALALVAFLALAAGYALPRPGRRGGDMMDAVAAVQRRSPRFLISEPNPAGNWVQIGAVYLCRAPRTAADVDGLIKDRWGHDPHWTGVICFQGTADPNQVAGPWAAEGGDCCLDYGAFAVFGDPEMLQEVQRILAAAGFQPTRDRTQPPLALPRRLPHPSRRGLPTDAPPLTNRTPSGFPRWVRRVKGPETRVAVNGGMGQRPEPGRVVWRTAADRAASGSVDGGTR